MCVCRACVGVHKWVGGGRMRRMGASSRILGWVSRYECSHEPWGRNWQLQQIIFLIRRKDKRLWWRIRLSYHSSNTARSSWVQRSTNLICSKFITQRMINERVYPKNDMVQFTRNFRWRTDHCNVSRFRSLAGPPRMDSAYNTILFVLACKFIWNPNEMR